MDVMFRLKLIFSLEPARHVYTLSRGLAHVGSVFRIKDGSHPHAVFIYPITYFTTYEAIVTPLDTNTASRTQALS